jgi:hypothetical protein
MSQTGAAVAFATAVFVLGCKGEGVEPPALRVMRYHASWPCAVGDSGRHDLTLNEVEVSGEPTMYDLVITCPPGDSVAAVVVERGRWSVVQDTLGEGGAPIVELYSADGPLLLRYRRVGADTLIPLDAGGTPQPPALRRVVESP